MDFNMAYGFCVLIVVLFLLLPDGIMHFNTWQARIKIGRYSTVDSWENKVLKRTLKWLKHTPTIKLTDNSRLIIIDIIKGNYKRDAIQYWQEAALVLGLLPYAKHKSECNTKSSITAFFDSKIDASGNWKSAPKEIDAAILAYAFLSIEWIDPNKNKPAYDTIWVLIQDLLGEDGTVKYRKSMPDYRYVDTIGFICPFLVKYGLQFNNENAIDLAINQITAFNQYGMYPDKFIPCHTYHLKSKHAVGLFGWGRGLGWYAIGLIDAWLALPNNHSQKKILTKCVVDFSQMAAQFQNPDGSWNWIVSSKEARPDSSTTATLLWFFTNAASIESISENSKSVCNKAIHYLMKVTRRNGSIDFSQGDTKGIGVHSQEFDILPFTQGFALRSVFRLTKGL
ncbi:glycoside hydrolase family 88 protein [Flavobacterium sp.]|uniref:glycoside hydrolase family 88 protein n=1 Tax=Flavobacterium sp. TaxID=239 RepID=UPI00261405A6|nr:glycoside hydrolase family 88 protein [Flavobacterium sp.]